MRSQKGVTTIELLVVIVVISIIALFGSITVSEVIDSTRKKGFVGSGISFVEASRLSHAANEPFWDDDIATFREILSSEYVAKLGNDPWGGTFDLDESYVIYDQNDNFKPYKLRMVTNQATLGFEEALGEFDKGDVVVLGSAGGNLIERVVQNFTGDLQDNVTGGDGHDLVEVGDDLQGSAAIDTKDGNDVITVADDIKGNTQVNTGAGDDDIYVGHDIAGRTVVDTGIGNDTITVDNHIKNYSEVYAGEGDDVVIIHNNMQGESHLDTGPGNDEVYLDGELNWKASMNTGDGNDTIVINDDIQQNTVVESGTGDDTVTVGDRISGNGVLDTGEGNDDVTVKNLYGGNLNTGSGNDEVAITNLSNNPNVDLESGNDVVVITDVSSRYEGTLSLGDGDDTITLLDNRGSKDLSGTSGTFDGGSGYDVLNLPNMSSEQWNEYASELFTNFEEVNLEDTVIYP